LAIVIGSSTAVTLEFPTGTVVDYQGVISVDWSFGTNLQRLYTLGAGSSDCGPNQFGSIRSSDVTVNFSLYGGVSPQMEICPPSDQCIDSPAQVIVTIVPGVCGSYDVDGLTAQAVYINSYGYSKDRTAQGTETWAGTAYVQGEQDLANKKYIEPEPTINVLGVSEGTLEGETDNLTLLQEVTGTEIRDLDDVVETPRGSVAAAALSVGEYTLTQNATFRRIGGSLFGIGDNGDGVLARANVTLTVQPLYFEE
jgi:hypothetical protein